MKYELLTISVCVIAALVLIGIIIYFVRQRRFERMVIETSEMLKSLTELNGLYQFWDDIERTYQYVKRFETKSKYDRCGYQILDEFILSYSECLLKAEVKCQENDEKYQEYLKKVKALVSTISQDQAMEMKVNLDKYKRTEKRLFDEKIQAPPITTAQVVVLARYTSPQGRNSYEKSFQISISDAAIRYDALKDEEKERQTSEHLRAIERSKMTPKLRYSILQRDGFRCKICGRGEKDGVKLHVDHIIPVSKGGKTEKENLRTLCEDCNLGKGARLEVVAVSTNE